MAEQPPEPKRRPRRLLILGVPVLLALALGGWLGVSGHPVVGQAAARLSGGAASAAGGAPGADSTAAPAPAPAPTRFGVFASFDGIVVNPKGSGGQRYLLVTVGVEAARQSTLDDLLSKEVVARDATISLLSARTVEELADLRNREALKAELLDAFNGLLRRGQVDRVYFTQYVLQ